jgi:hypothetical protein
MKIFHGEEVGYFLRSQGHPVSHFDVAQFSKWLTLRQKLEEQLSAGSKPQDPFPLAVSASETVTLLILLETRNFNSDRNSIHFRLGHHKVQILS